MRVFLVVPPVLFAQQAPISIAYLVAYLKRRGHDVRAWDLNIEISIPNDSDDQFWENYLQCSDFFENNKSLFDNWVEKILEFVPDVVGFSVWRSTEYFAIRMAEMLKKKDKNIQIIFGGSWCSLGGRRLISDENVDVLVYGEGELTLADIIESHNLKKPIQGCLIKHNGEIKDYGARKEIENLDNLPFPNLSFFSLDKYLFKNHVPISFSRGCDWRCSYCITNCLWRKLRVRSAESIYSEIVYRLKEFPELRGFRLYDPSINSDINLLSNLCELLIKNNITIGFDGYAQIKPQMTPKLLKKLRKVGFLGLGYGMESGSQRILNKMKRPYTVELAERVIKDTYNAGIGVVLGFIVGFPGESEQDFQSNLNFIKKVKRHVTHISSASECWISGTYIANNPEEFGIIYRNNNWETSEVTEKIRKHRVEKFNDFVRDLGVALVSPTEDRKFYTEKSKGTIKFYRNE